MPQRVTQRTGRRTGYAGLALLAVAIAAPLVEGDTIVLANGNTLSDVTVTNATFERVAYETDGLPQSVDADQVLELERASHNLSSVRGAFERGDYARAVKAVDDVLRFGKDWEKAEASYLRGKSLLESAKQDAASLDAAVRSLDGYLQEYRAAKDFFVPHATFALGSAYLQGDKTKSARQQFEALRRDFGGRSSVWKYRATIGEARAIVAAGSDPLQARRILNDVANDRLAPAIVRREANVLRGRVMNEQGQYDEAKQTLERFFFGADASYDEFFAEACLLVGDSFAGRGTRSDQEEAEIWYLKATLFGKAYPRIFREAGTKLVALYKDMGSTERAEEWQNRVRRLDGASAAGTG
jgi:tetratricopeptide (TPR) repeat protein